MNWQPMNTAPIGTKERIIVCGADGVPEVARWNPRLNKWCADFLGVRTDSTEWILEGEHEPVWWMPMPAPPQTGSDE